MCVTLWTQWSINEDLPTTKPKFLLTAIPVTGDTSQAVLAAAAAAGPHKDFLLAATTAGPGTLPDHKAVVAATAAAAMHAARLFADVDPGGCGALTLRHLHDSSEAGAMGRGHVPHMCTPLRFSQLL